MKKHLLHEEFLCFSGIRFCPESRLAAMMKIVDDEFVFDSSGVCQRQWRPTVCTITLPASRVTADHLNVDGSRAADSFRSRAAAQRTSVKLGSRLMSVSFTHHGLRSAIEIDDASAVDRRAAVAAWR